MSTARHAPANGTAARRAGSTKTRRGRPRKSSAHKNNVHKSNAHATVVQKPAGDEATSDERIIRAKGLLAATLRVWELKHRISD